MPLHTELFSNPTQLQSLLAQSTKPSFSALKKAFLDSVKENTNGLEKAAVLFSGGLDSGLIAKAVSGQIVSTTLFAVGLRKSTAFNFSQEAAKLLDLGLERVPVKESELPVFLEKARKALNSGDFLQLQIAVPELIAMNAAREQGFTHIFSGQGADELFFGYDEFRRSLAEGHSFEELEELRKAKLTNLWRDNLARDLAISKSLGLELRAPFLEPEFITQALAFPAQENISSGSDLLRKRVLRKLAEGLGVPKEISQRRKKAIQYDSGFSRELKKLVF